MANLSNIALNLIRPCVNITLLLLQANSGMAAFTAVAVDIVGMWLRTVLDDGKRSALKYFTLVGPCTPPAYGC